MATRTIAPPTTAADLEGTARRFAAMSRTDAESVIDTHVAAAVREWRVTDATFWQRVKFRSRMIRTTGAHRLGQHARG